MADVPFETLIMEVAEKWILLGDQPNRAEQFLTSVLERIQSELLLSDMNQKEIDAVLKSVLHSISDTAQAIHRRRSGSLS